MDSRRSLAPRPGQAGVTSSSREPLSSPEHTRTTTQDTHHSTTPRNTSNQPFHRFGAMCRSAACPWRHPNDSGATQRPPREEGYMPPLLQHTPAAVSAPQKGKEPQAGRHARSQPIGNRAAPHTAVGRAPAGHSAAHRGHAERAPQQPPNVADAERAIGNQAPPSLHEVPPNSTRSGVKVKVKCSGALRTLA